MGSLEQQSSEEERSCAALASALEKLRVLVERLTNEQYTRAGMKGFDSPIAAHVRHCVDHVDALLLGLQDGEPGREIRYDRRERGTQIETDREHALATCRSRRDQVLALEPRILSDPVRVLAMVTPDHPEQLFDSTGSREMLYVFHHTVHHLALMAAHAEYLGASMEHELGRAPATLAADQDD